MERWKFCTSTTFEICHFQPVVCVSKNPISPKVLSRFSKSFAPLDDVERGYLGKVAGGQVFYFCNAKVKTFAHRQHLKFCHSQRVHCASKNPKSSTVFNRFSKSLPQPEDVQGGHLGGKFQVRTYFTFAMARWKLCASTTFEICHFQNVHCASKNPISPKVSTDFRNLCLSSKMLRVGIWGKVSSAHVFYFCNGKVKTFHMTTFEILPLSTCTLWQRKPNIFNGIQPIFEILASARRCWGWALGWEVSGAHVFYFCHGKVKTFRIDNIWNLPLSKCTLCMRKPYICKGIQPIFEIFASAGKCWGWAFGWEVSGTQIFYFCNGKVKILHIDNIWNFATFNL